MSKIGKLVRSFTGIVALALLLPVAGCPESPETVSAGRFEVHALQTSSGPILVRFDTATGELTQSPLTGGREWAGIGSIPAVGAGLPTAGRYSLDYVQGASIPLTFIRLDTETGAVWRLRHPGDRDWVSLRSASTLSAPPAAAPVAARERRAPAATAPTPTPGPVLAMSEVGSLGAPTDGEVQTLVEAATSPDLPTDMRAWAIEQLGDGPSEKAVAPLVDLLSSEDPTVVRTAIRALGKHEDPRVKPALEQLAEHEAPEVRRVAESVLSRLR